MSEKKFTYMISTPSKTEYSSGDYTFCLDEEELKRAVLKMPLDHRARFYKIEEIKVDVNVATN
jgi:hypothetical protein